MKILLKNQKRMEEMMIDYITINLILNKCPKFNLLVPIMLSVISVIKAYLKLILLLIIYIRYIFKY